MNQTNSLGSINIYIYVCVNFLVQGLIHNCHPIIIMNIIQDIAYYLIPWNKLPALVAPSVDLAFAAPPGLLFVYSKSNLNYTCLPSYLSLFRRQHLLLCHWNFRYRVDAINFNSCFELKFYFNCFFLWIWNTHLAKLKD